MLFRKTTQADIDFVANNSISRGICNKQPEFIDYCYTLEHEGKPLGIGGFRLINSTTAWTWTDWTCLAGAHIIVVYRTVKEWLALFAEEHKLKRLQAYIESDFPEAIRMVERLGFHRESIMLNFVGNRPVYLYVKFYGVSDDTKSKLE